jgi:hypothetical protein
MSWLRPLAFGTVVVVSVAISIHPDDHPNAAEPFVIKLNGSSFYDAGRQHGVLAKGRISRFLKDPSVKELVNFRNGNGRVFFDELVRINRQEFPQYAEEVRGIAVGAEVLEEDIWISNLLGELSGASEYNLSSGLTRITLQNSTSLASDSLTNYSGREHCSSFLFRDKSGDLAFAHNEDWSDRFEDLLYLTDVTYPTGERLWGFGYPGQILGFAVVINSHGIVVTQNSMWPKHIQAGLGVTFIGRRALAASNLGAAVAATNVSGQAYGNSLNFLSLDERSAANVETTEDKSYVAFLSEKEPYLYHFNNFVRAGDVNAKVSRSTRGRMVAETGRAPPQSTSELQERLCYLGNDGKCTSHDCIYRKDTMLSWFFHVTSHGEPTASIWYKASPCDVPPRFQWRPGEGFSEMPPRSKPFLGTKTDNT